MNSVEDVTQTASDPRSFRDPSGHVFNRNGKIYRSIFEPGVKDFEAARDAGIYDKLVERGLLFPHDEVNLGDPVPEGTVYCLSHPRLPMISYPWEWPFSILKGAALIHLDAMEMLLPHGFWLRDASAFNVQYDGNRLCLIDTLSIGHRIAESPWVAYGQFCSHFLAPLAMAAYCDIRTLSLWRNYIDGYPLDLVTKMLPFWRRYRPGLFMHLALHARFQDAADRKEDIGKAKSAKKPKVNDRGLIGLVRSLRRTVGSIKWKRSSRIWEEYGEIRSYQAEDVSRKSEYVDRVVRRLEPDMVWDLGGNTGEFSLIAAHYGAFVVSIDGDPACTEYLYQRVSGANGTKRILPLTMDLGNPSPGLGWDGKERSSLSDRGPADLMLALALIHHLVFSCCVPLSLIAEWFASLADHVLVEFIPPTDPMVEKLLRNRGDEHLPYNLEVFNLNFEKSFEFIDKTLLPNGRTLFLCKRRVK
ncbi:MAG: SAM-dependent methyltransferase [Deltaproteobacteria bacterium]|nr:SAM-dependent methyltransferase [Deltaproteobacteria bacterium]